MNLEEFMIEFWKEDDTIEVNCQWLQKLIKEKNDLLYKHKQLQNKIEDLNLLLKVRSKSIPYLDIKI